MGLTSQSVGTKAIDQTLVIKKITDHDFVIALAGNPNVGKSTVFNALTGLKQHTGNWPGKTVTNAQGIYTKGGKNYVLVDLPGTYSLFAHSAEEEIARDFICFGGADGVIIVCDATCLERNLNLVLQTLEITTKVVVCVNLMDEAKRKNIIVDLNALSEQLGVPVIGTSARNGRGLSELMQTMTQVIVKPAQPTTPIVVYAEALESAIYLLEAAIAAQFPRWTIHPRWLAVKLLDEEPTLLEGIANHFGASFMDCREIYDARQQALQQLATHDIHPELLTDMIVSSIVQATESIAKKVVHFKKDDYQEFDRKVDRVLTNKITGFPLMIMLLGLVFWLTITGSNYPSQWLSKMFFWVENQLFVGAVLLHIPPIIYEPLIFGVYRVLTWVVSVMLPPMAIFFPLFTLLEDLGYLPRVAFNLDHTYKKCCACGKQALTMCMGFGCNAAGVIGCRIIDSPRERLIAILTNNFVPCNGRFPTLIAMITMFFVTAAVGPFQSIIGAILLTLFILLGIGMTFFVSYLLSKTILKGQPSSFTLELPPYRKPKIGQIILHSIFDRTLFVLGRAVLIAAPAGLVIWIFSNTTIGGTTLLAHCNHLLDPLGRAMGMDGVILFAFILGFPANEIVVPIIIMSYMATGHIVELNHLDTLKALLLENGWTWLTAVNMMLFCLFHWPCSTTCLTIKKETGSIKWTLLSFLIPTAIGMFVCFVFTTIVRLFIFA